MTTNQTVLAYARQRVGRQVGSGECFDLADEALRNAGASSASDYGPITPTADYVWGRRVSRQEAQPGDIIQFRNYSMLIETETRVRVDTGGGGFEESFETVTETQSRGHHTAVVEAIEPSGRLNVLEQNVGTGADRRRVQSNELFFVTRTNPPQTTREGNVTTTVRRTVTVRGQAWFYRPQTSNGGR